MSFSFKKINYLSFLKNPKNRFYDKSYQLVVSKNGMVGCNIEHSPFDGMVSSTITEFLIVTEKNIKIEPKTVIDLIRMVLRSLGKSLQPSRNRLIETCFIN